MKPTKKGATAPVKKTPAEPAEDAKAFDGLMSKLNEELDAPAEKSTAIDSFDSFNSARSLENEVNGYLHDVRRHLDTMLRLMDEGMGVTESALDVTSDEGRRDLARHSRDVFVEALRALQGAEDALERFRQDAADRVYPPKRSAA